MSYVEAQMSEPLTKWLKRRGYSVYTEVRPRLSARSIDMVGHREKDDSLVIIEMKKNLTTKSNYKRWNDSVTCVIDQAVNSQRYSETIYCAVLSSPMERGLGICRERGVGVLRVDVKSGMIHRLVEPSRKIRVSEHCVVRLMHALEHKESGGVGGMPNVRGVGPAQTAYDCLVEYRVKNPDATWEEVYRDVPNHYAHAQSMRQSLEKIEVWRAAEGILENEPLFAATRRLVGNERKGE